jgi:hypothetical protein
MKKATDDDYRAWAASLGEIEDRISIEQDAKRDLYASIRASHGRIVADALKSAMRVHRMGDEKREHREQINAETAHIVEVLKTSVVGAPQQSNADTIVEEIETVAASPLVEEPQASAKEAPDPAKVSELKFKPLPKPEIEELVLDSGEIFEDEFVEEIIEAA